jgi:hypothetical protein
MTPEQHRQAALRLRIILASQPGAFDPAWAQRIARNHKLIADVISRREQQHPLSPPLAPE